MKYGKLTSTSPVMRTSCGPTSTKLSFFGFRQRRPACPGSFHPGFDQPPLLQQQQATPLVHRIIGNAHLPLRARGVHGFVLERIQAHIGQKLVPALASFEAVFLHRAVQNGWCWKKLMSTDRPESTATSEQSSNPVNSHHFHLQPLSSGAGGSVDGIGIHARQHANLRYHAMAWQRMPQAGSSAERIFQMSEPWQPFLSLVMNMQARWLKLC